MSANADDEVVEKPNNSWGERSGSRRDFLRAAAAGVAAAPLLALDNAALAQRGNTNATQLLKETELKDQYGQVFKPDVTLAGRPYMLVFGYQSCPFCQNISGNLGAAQQAMIDKGLIKEKQEIPIVLVSIKPEKDQDRPTQYLADYYAAGVRQNLSDDLKNVGEDERRRMGEKAFARDKALDARSRTLHVLCASDADKALAIHDALGLRRAKRSPNAHSPEVLIVGGDGKVAASVSAGINGNDFPDRRKAIAEDLTSAVERANNSRYR